MANVENGIIYRFGSQFYQCRTPQTHPMTIKYVPYIADMKFLLGVGGERL